MERFQQREREIDRESDGEKFSFYLSIYTINYIHLPLFGHLLETRILMHARIETFFWSK